MHPWPATCQTLILFGLAAWAVVATGRQAAGGEQMVPVTLSGGHEIGSDDFGRPVTLIAAALAVKPEVFRQAFSGVTPARGRGPSRAEAQQNKTALLRVLGPHGVTNDRLDEVSDHYRYQPQRGELWPTTEAKAHAVVVNGKVQKIVVTNPGSGYCSPPKATVTGYPKLQTKVTLALGPDLKKNGGIRTIEIVSMKAAK